MRLGLLATAIVVGAPLAVAAAASAQVQRPSHTNVGTKPRLESVEQMVEDISPLALSLRSFQTDLRLPSGFESVYRAPDDDGGGQRLMRIDGALAATFPQSVYAPVYTRERFMLLFSRERKIGYVPTVPAGTVYYIGLPEVAPELKPEGPSRSQPELQVTQTPAAQRAEVESAAPLPLAERPVARSGARPLRLPSQEAKAQARAGAMAGDADANEARSIQPLREERLRELLRRAVAGERGAKNG